MATVVELLTDGSTLLKTVTKGNTQPQFILSAANIASTEQQAFIQQLLLQNTLVTGCNSLLVTSVGRLDATNSVATCTGVPATIKAENDINSMQATGSQNECHGTDEVSAADYELVVFNHGK